MKRDVEPVAAFLDEVLNDFRAPSKTCVTGADFLLEELERQDPDLEDRCGLLADRYEIYAIEIPKCAHLVLVVSLDTAGSPPWPCTIHGLLAAKHRPCEAARQRATKHFRLIDPSWEPA